jgi:hypothetical protein
MMKTMRWRSLVVLALAGCTAGDAQLPPAPVDLAVPPSVRDLAFGCPSPNFGVGPIWTPPIGSHSGACSDADLETFVSMVLSDGATGAAQFASPPSPCGKCLIGAVVPPSNAAFINSTNGVLDANVGGCVALLAAATDPSSCGAHVSAFDQCTAAACLDCAPVRLAADLVAYDKCLSAAGTQASCSPYAQPAQCIDAVPGAAKCRSTGWSSTGDWLRFVADLFCGSASDM